MKRRRFLTTLAGALLAPKVDVAPAIGSFRGCYKVAPAAGVAAGARAAQLAALQRCLQANVSSAWTNRYREALNGLHHPSNPHLTLTSVGVDGEAGLGRSPG